MRIGKLENHELEALVLRKFKKVRSETLTMPRVGEDCAAIDLKGELAILSMDPITSADERSLGLLTVHVNCNDAVCMGADPVALLVTLLVPPDFPEKEIGRIADDLSEAAVQAHVDIVGGHTEYTDAVTRPLTCASVIAKMPKGHRLSGIKVGDALVMTKSAALEGTAILASRKDDSLLMLSPALLMEAKSYFSQLSVVPEGRVAVAHGAHAMHDVTEGGVLGAAWEICYGAGLGLLLDANAIPVSMATREICALAHVDPLRLLGSGSLLIGCGDGPAMVNALRRQGIPAVIIGQVQEKGCFFLDGTPLAPPKEDALYHAFGA